MKQMLRALRRELERHDRGLKSPDFWVAATYHYGVWSLGVRPPPLQKASSKLFGLMQLGVQLATGCTIHREAEIGEDLHLIHAWNIRIHPGTVIGARCGIMHDVTIGTTPDGTGVPTIGDDVFIGAGAKIVGGITIGDRARIGANSLVISDVPPDSTAVGVPARILRLTGREKKSEK